MGGARFPPRLKRLTIGVAIWRGQPATVAHAKSPICICDVPTIEPYLPSYDPLRYDRTLLHHWRRHIRRTLFRNALTPLNQEKPEAE